IDLRVRRRVITSGSYRNVERDDLLTSFLLFSLTLSPGAAPWRCGPTPHRAHLSPPVDPRGRTNRRRFRDRLPSGAGTHGPTPRSRRRRRWRARAPGPSRRARRATALATPSTRTAQSAL